MHRKSVRGSVGIIGGLMIGVAAAQSQGLIVDQATGDLNEVLINFSPIPPNQLAQSFTPSFSAVGFVQLSQVVPALPGNDQIVVVINLREGAYNGPIISSTAPVLLVNKFTLISTFYFSENVSVTPGQLYFFEPVLQSTGAWDLATKAPYTYPGGALWSNGQEDPQANLWFREGIVGVPEPGAVGLLALGLGTLLWRRRLS